MVPNNEIVFYIRKKLKKITIFYEGRAFLINAQNKMNDHTRNQTVDIILERSKNEIPGRAFYFLSNSRTFSTTSLLEKGLVI